MHYKGGKIGLCNEDSDYFWAEFSDLLKLQEMDLAKWFEKPYRDFIKLPVAA